jgi:hypothetical protein
MGCNISIKWRKVRLKISFSIQIKLFRLNEIYKKAFSQWNIDQQIGTKSIERYPLLIGLSRHKNGDYQFKYLIDGSDKRPIMDEFLAQLIQHKDQFDDNEEDFERVKNFLLLNNQLVSFFFE